MAPSGQGRATGVTCRFVICATCTADNPAGNRFCGNCGVPLLVTCGSCGTSSTPGTRFCGNCGEALDANNDPATARSATAERRLVTVLFADLTGFTAFSADRDHEEVREFQTKYFEAGRQIVERFGGIVEKFIGDAVMAVWGAEVANEDDAERAIRTGFELIDLIAKLAADIGAADLNLRVGVHTGEAAVGATDDHMGFVTGDLVNTASRLQSAADPGTILVGEATMAATQQSIAFEPTGPQTFKGKTAPMMTWHAVRILSERGGRGRAESLEPPFVGRGDELRLLKDLLHTVGEESRVRLVSLVGEAGIGKSRLIWEFLKYVDGLVEEIYWHEGRSPSYGDGVTFWAISEMIKARAGIGQGDTAETIGTRLDEAIEQWVAEPADRNWVKPHLDAIVSGGEAPGSSSEFGAAVRAFFEGISEHGTTVLVFEDLHWADPALLDFVEELTDWWRGHPILVITMARPDLLERRPSWGSGRQGFVSLTVGPLADTKMRELVDGAVPGLPDEVVEVIVGRSAGIPLYAVELLRSMLVQGELAGEKGSYRFVGDITRIEVPESLQAVIGARLDRLDPEERSLLQDAAVLGQTFPVSGLTALTGLARPELEASLNSLARREMIEPIRSRSGADPGQYRFLQGLIRDVALGRLSRENRRTRHVAVAEHMESLDDPELAGIIASHYLDALDATTVGEDRDLLRARALTSMERAASRARDLQAHEQVVTIARSALDIADDDTERVVFWEMIIEGAGRITDVPLAEKMAELAIAHHQAGGADEEVFRVRVALATQLVDNLHPERVAELILPYLGPERDFAESALVARAAACYGRAMMLSLDEASTVVAYLERVLPALEELGMTAELIDTLVTRGTSLAMADRLVESRMVMEGASALAEKHELYAIQARALNNIAYSLVGVDDPASAGFAEEAYRIATRLGDRNLLIFHATQIVELYVARGEFDRAEEILANPFMVDLAPAAHGASLMARLRMLAWCGDVEGFELRLAELAEIREEIDDPQSLSYVDSWELESCLVRGDLERMWTVAADGLEGASWYDVSEHISYSLLAAALLGDRERLAALVPIFEGFRPRYTDFALVARALATSDQDGIDQRRLDALIANEFEKDSPADAVRWMLTTAPYVGADKKTEYLGSVREISTRLGWNGLLALADRYLD